MTYGSMPPWLKQLAAILSTIAVIAGALAAILGSGGGSNPPPVVTSQTRDGKTITVPKAAVQQVQKTDAGGHTLLGPGADTNITRERDNRAASPQAPSISGPVPLASPHQAGCITRQNSNNWSYRNGIRPSIIPIHLTVSPNVPGWSDVNGNWAFLNRAATQASANYIVDGEGHCVYAVPETLKAWAQANFNSASACAIEVVNYGNSGHESSYIAPAGMRQLARIVHDCAARWHIPLREGRVSGCSVVRSGVVDHDHLGICGGGHNDITPYGSGCRRTGGGEGTNTWPCVDAVIAAAKGGSKPPPTAHANKLCRELMHYRREMAAKPPTFPEAQRGRYNAVRGALVRAKYRCSTSGRAIRK